MTVQRSIAADTSRSQLARSLVAHVGRAFESLATVSVLFLISGAVFPLLRGGADPAGLNPPTAIERLCTWCAYLFVLLQVGLHPVNLLRAAMRNPLVPGVIFIAFLSGAWSDDPTTSLKEAAGLSIWTVFGFYLASQFTTEELLRRLGIALATIAVLSLAFGLLLPAYGISQQSNAGAWRGVFIQKNQLGHTMLVACIVFALLARGRAGWPRAIVWVFLMLAITLILLSRSKMALVIFCALAVIMPAVVAFRRGGRAAVVALSVLLAGATGTVIAVTERDLVLSALGKDATLTGRTQLWTAVAGNIAKRPLLGYGYRAFWEAGTPSSEALRAAVGWDAPHSHNAFLDLWLDLGALGLATFLGAYLVAARRAWLALQARLGLEGLWAMAIAIMFLPLNMVASPLYEDRLIWVLFVAVSAQRITLNPSG